MSAVTSVRNVRKTWFSRKTKVVHSDIVDKTNHTVLAANRVVYGMIKGEKKQTAGFVRSEDSGGQPTVTVNDQGVAVKKVKNPEGGFLKRGAVRVGRRVVRLSKLQGRWAMRGAGYVGLGIVSILRAVWWIVAKLFALVKFVAVIAGSLAVILVSAVLWLVGKLIRMLNSGLLYLHDAMNYFAKGRPVIEDSEKSFKNFRAAKQDERSKEQLAKYEEMATKWTKFGEHFMEATNDFAGETVWGEVVKDEAVKDEAVKDETVEDGGAQEGESSTTESGLGWPEQTDESKLTVVKFNMNDFASETPEIPKLDMDKFPALENPKEYDWAQHLDDPTVIEAYDFFADRCFSTDDVKGYSYWTARSYARTNIPTMGWNANKIHGKWCGEINRNDHDTKAGWQGVKDEVTMLEGIRDQIAAQIAAKKADNKS